SSTGLARKPAASAGAIIRQLMSIRLMTRLSGTSMNTSPPPAPLAGDCELARLILARQGALHQQQRPRRVQLQRRRQLLPLQAVNTHLLQARTRSFRGLPTR